MSRVVFDASAVLCLLLNEPRSRALSQSSALLANAVMSSVNAAEVAGKLILKGMDVESAWQAVSSVASEVLPFTGPHAKLASALVWKTRPFGLSLGDRACLALAIETGGDVYTTDRVWAQFETGVQVHVLE